MYYLVYGLLYTMSLLPIQILYGIGSFAGWLLFRVFGYRREVITNNLARAFPDKSGEDRALIRKKFERNFTDTFIEVVKSISWPESTIKKRMTGNFDLIHELYEKGLSCQVHLGHNFNWELLNLAYGYYAGGMPLLTVYMPLHNKVMDRIFRKLRSRSGNILLPATNMRAAMMPYRNSQYALALVADQVPGNTHSAWWLRFFDTPTPFIPGPEKGARAGNIPVAFAQVTKVKRGYYQVEITLVTENPASYPPGALTRMYRDYLEKTMRQHPDMWLWSHRRWKHAWNSSYASQWIDTTPIPTVP